MPVVSFTWFAIENKKKALEEHTEGAFSPIFFDSDACVGVLMPKLVSAEAEVPESNNGGQNQQENRNHTTFASTGTILTRVIIHGHHPNDDELKDGSRGKLIHLPNSIEELFEYSRKQVWEERK
ncbi:uncharacterized protein LOC116007602 isoform X3 [Ipomoea triloba]|uniref:uncharacterized protein LOC116007602 isoform X3 n=1 Tax=Ipomoea triloba TaxID=35885 RepID=UPI00125E991B|nr:uncharacterized protein LOC116007602 isoform X3 [Ipomoea triloba]